MNTPFYLYVTRPYAYEIYMGGWRNMRVWTDEPQYFHGPGRHDAFYGTSERGWSDFDDLHGSRAKPLFKDDPLLGEAIWREVFWSVLPKGMTAEEGETWWKEQSDFDSRRDDNWHNLFADRNWEAKCNLCHKRFLLKIDVRNSTVERIAPRVYLPNWFATPDQRIIRTFECETEELAIRLKVRPEEEDIPW